MDENESGPLFGNELEPPVGNEAETLILSILDLLLELWDSSLEATRNFRLLLGTVSAYLKTHGNADSRRACEGREMRRVLVAVHKKWVTQGGSLEACSKRNLLDFVRYNLSELLRTDFTKGLMTEETFNEWVNECKGRVTDRGEETLEGLDELFEFAPEQDPELIVQNMTKLENGRLLTVKTPGEFGSQMIRVHVYDTMAIVDKEKRHWWKYAKLRTQFLSSSAKTDTVQQLLNQLFEVVAQRLVKIPGVVKETRNVVDDSVSRQRRSVKRKRCADDDSLESI